jgi:hypothetical protein
MDLVSWDLLMVEVSSCAEPARILSHLVLDALMRHFYSAVQVFYVIPKAANIRLCFSQRQELRNSLFSQHTQ